MIGARHIVIAGNIGVGKSTLVDLLGARFGARTYFESVDDHPYLERFYEDMRRWAFHSQFWFLGQAFRQHCEIVAGETTAVQDRSLYEHFHVFAGSLAERGLLDADDHAVLEQHYNALTAILPAPDLVVWLRGSIDTLQQRIAQRSRDMESGVEDDYLRSLDARYEQWMAGWDASDVLVVDTDDVDIHDSEQRDALVATIEAKITQVGGLAVA